MTLRERVEKEIARMADLPVVSRILVELNQVAGDESASAEDLGQVIMGDQPLSLRLLRVVNSSYYRGEGQQSVTTISKAVVLLGFEGVRRLALGMVVFDRLYEGSQVDAGRHIAGRSLLNAVVARYLARSCRYEPAEEAFVTGLIRDMGKLVLLRCDPGIYANILEQAEDDAALRRLERRHFGVSYPQVGRMLARQWDLPRPLRDAFGERFIDQTEPTAGLQLQALTTAAHEAAGLLERDPSGQELAVIIGSDACYCGVPTEHLAELHLQVGEDYAEMADVLGVTDVLAAVVPDEVDGAAEDATPAAAATGSPSPTASAEKTAVPVTATDSPQDSATRTVVVDRAEALKRLGELQEALLASSSEVDPLAFGVVALRATLDADRVLLWRMAPDSPRLACVEHAEGPDRRAEALEAVPTDEKGGALARCLQEGKPVRIPDPAASDPDGADCARLARLGAATAVLLPLIDREHPHGVLWIDGGPIGGASEEEALAVAGLFAQALTLALARAESEPVAG